MTEKIQIDIPRRGFGNDLAEALAAHGLRGEVVETDERCALNVSFANDEHDRLLDQAVDAIESYLSDNLLPLVVQRTNGGAVVRPAGD